ncbi:MAG: tetratricopeptide repeat protein [Cyclobacteriaceae bacterium]
MKTITFIFVLLFSTNVFATDSKYMEQMGKHIQAVYAAQTVEQYQDAVNAFDRIAAAEKTKWEPYYYSAFGSVMMANNEKEAPKKDAYLDKALAAIETGKSINPSESELVALEGFVHMIRVTVDPATRGQQYSGIAFQTYNKALDMNSENPRALGFLAQMQMGVARFMGSPTSDACETGRKALEKFTTYKSDNPLAPQWGKGMTEGLLQSCK